MSSLSEYEKFAEEYKLVTEFAFNNLRDYRQDPDILRSVPSLLWEEVTGSVKRFYRINQSRVIDIPEELSFALTKNIDLAPVVAKAAFSEELKKFILLLICLTEKNYTSEKLQDEYEKLFAACTPGLVTEDRDTVGVIITVALSSSLVVSDLHSNDALLNDLRSRTPTTQGNINWGKVGAVAAVGAAVGAYGGGVGGAIVGGIGSGTIAIIMML